MKFLLLDQFEIFQLVILMICLILSNIFLIQYWQKINLFFNLETYKNIQSVHERNIPRMGGLLIFTIYFFYIAAVSKYDKFFFNLLLSFLPTAIISIKEDLFQNTTQTSRIFVMILSCLIFFNIDQTNFPLINLPILRFLYLNNYILLGFFIFSSLVIMNGSNLIDGMNGLFGMSILIQLITIIFMASILNDLEVFKIGIIILLPVIVYLFFNYPLGKIFMGDFGAYFFGFALSILVIKLFGNNKELLSWNAVLILFYPSMELLFSFIRKVFYEKKDPLKADDLHLHTLVYKLGLQMNIKPNLANNMVVIFLAPFWISPFTVVKIFNDLNLILFTLFLLSSIYISSYFFLRKNLK
jgi:UDP-GlcNAc:undecaprenyl-phosphate/decaprenyl-phosphate GlcNAc-1-phosphate transferase